MAATAAPWRRLWRDYYDILGTAPAASLEEIRHAYRRGARILHPDRLQQEDEATRREAERRLRLLNEAYEVLSDPSTRAEYDAEYRRRSGASPSRPTGTGPRARLRVVPDAVHLTSVVPGEPVKLTLTAESAGGVGTGSPEVLSMQSWLEVKILSVDPGGSPSGSSWCLTLLISTSRLAALKEYAGVIVVRLDDAEAAVPVILETAELATWTSEKEGSRSGSSPHRPTVPVRRQMGWWADGIPWGLQLVFATIGGLILPFILLAWAAVRFGPENPMSPDVASWVVPVSVLAMLGTIYALIEMRGFSDPHRANLLAGIAGSVSIVAGILSLVGALIFIVAVIVVTVVTIACYVLIAAAALWIAGAVAKAMFD